MKGLVARFVRDDSGQDLIEYGLLIGIITTALVLVITQIGTKVKLFFDNLISALDSA